MSERSLEDDEAALAGYANELVDAADDVLAAWMLGCVARHAPELAVRGEVEAAMRSGAAAVVGELRALLGSDIADQHTGPLEVIRRGVRFPTEVLLQAGIAPVERDEFAERNFPDDVYDLVPASFAGVASELHEPGLVWGAAKAHVHLRRRRESPQPDPRKVVAVVPDLMDRSKVAAAFPQAVFVGGEALIDEAADADLVLVDLGRLGDIATLAQITTRVVAFGSHVDDERLAEAEAAGAEAVARSVFFKRLASRGV